MNNETLEIGLAPFIKKWGEKQDWMVRSVGQLIDSIENKDAEHLRALVGNTDNKASREAFYLIFQSQEISTLPCFRSPALSNPF